MFFTGTHIRSKINANIDGNDAGSFVSLEHVLWELLLFGSAQVVEDLRWSRVQPVKRLCCKCHQFAGTLSDVLQTNELLNTKLKLPCSHKGYHHSSFPNHEIGARLRWSSQSWRDGSKRSSHQRGPSDWYNYCHDTMNSFSRYYLSLSMFFAIHVRNCVLPICAASRRIIHRCALKL